MSGRPKNGCRKCCFRTVQWFPVLFLALIIAWSYYAYIYSLCVVVIKILALKIVFGVLYHVVLIIFAWSYAKVILEPPRTIPKEFYLTDQDWQQLHNVHSTESDKSAIIDQLVKERNLPVYMVGTDGTTNVCQICGLIKPDRTHHCSTCGKCILQMDHHCPWTNCCIGFHNHKYFIIFLGWGTVYCFYIAATSAAYFGEFFTGLDSLTVDRFMVLFLFIVAIMFGLCQLCLGGYHVYLAARNQTTLETFATPKFRNGYTDAHAFDVGRKENLRDMFGTNCCTAIFPVKTTRGDGIHWRYKFMAVDENVLETGQASSPTSLTSLKQ
ncbi:unnamed protein product [Calicophoron daubneyi]|uniref:Palmitoyltransferase n=1 Tax=Calicophoron daubneyi TaxID=300641 RepID=A0AAV2TAA8_CALDB